MFSKLALLALVAPLASALRLEYPQNIRSATSITIRWENQEGDPDTFSLLLANEVFHDTFAIANNVDPAQNSITLDLPVVPAGTGYTLHAVNIGNVGDVFAETPVFYIGENNEPTTSVRSTSTTSTSNTRSSSSATSSSSSTLISTTPLSSSSFGTTVRITSTPTGTSTTEEVAPAVTNTPFNGASTMKSSGGALAVMVLSAIAGAVVAL